YFTFLTSYFRTEGIVEPNILFFTLPKRKYSLSTCWLFQCFLQVIPAFIVAEVLSKSLLNLYRLSQPYFGVVIIGQSQD
ncbi:hypothetical protein, partial [Bacillus spizizenii]|uniref:hypothetical protein n=1 Tax=Bacillus spizizenii TaxID=96241 RepID=UPI001BB22233